VREIVAAHDGSIIISDRGQGPGLMVEARLPTLNQIRPVELGGERAIATH
jgi:hypothetical protein